MKFNPPRLRFLAWALVAAGALPAWASYGAQKAGLSADLGLAVATGSRGEILPCT